MEIQDISKDFKIKFDKKIKQIKYGRTVFIILTMDNELYGYVIGNNNNRYFKDLLGLNKYDELNKLNVNIGKIKYLECGYFFTIIVNEFNEFYFVGSIIFGVIESDNFIKMDFINLQNEKIKLIKCSFNRFYIVTENNSIFVFGLNYNGELGFENKIEEPFTILTKLENLNLEIKDLQCGLEHAILLDKFGIIYGTGRNIEKENKFTKINLPFKVKKIACSQNNTLILNENNELFVAGNNIYGKSELNNSSKINFFTKVDCNVKKIFTSFGYYNLYLTSMNELFIGSYLGYDSLNKKIAYKKFTKVDKIKVDKQYIYPLLLFDGLFILQSNYKINDKDNDTLLSLKCLQKLYNNQLIDLNIIVIEENRKKRKLF